MSKTGNLNRKKPCQRCESAPRIPGGGNRYCHGCRAIVQDSPSKPTPVDLIGSKRPIAHGTMTGYYQCVKFPSGPCEPCRIACRVQSAELRRRRGRRERTGPSSAAFLLAGRTAPPTDEGCWPWTGVINSQGYGVLTIADQTLPGSAPRSLREKNVAAHRASYEHHIGPIPAGLTLDHLCHTRAVDCPGGPQCLHRRCVNPQHLDPCTSAENTKRGRSANKTHCRHGHEYSAENTGRDSEGYRLCLTCRRMKDRRQRKQVAS
jgi:hypothetical protein